MPIGSRHRTSSSRPRSRSSPSTDRRAAAERRPPRSRPPSRPRRARRSDRGPRRADRPQPQPGAGRAVTTTDGPLLILAGRRQRQDPRPRPPRRVPDRRQGRPAVADPRGHVHEPRRRRAAGADRSASSASPAATSRRARSTRSARGSCAAMARRSGSTARFVIYDTDDQQALMKQILREEDLPATGEFRPSVILGAISRAKNEMVDADVPARRTPSTTTTGWSPACAGCTRSGCKAGALDFDDLLLEAVRLFERAPESLAPLPGSLALPPRRRVPGHEPAAVPVDPGARRAATATWRRRRRRPVDLLVARRGHPQHPRLRARLSRRHGRQARAELPLHPAHPRRRPRGRLEQHARARTRSSGRRTSGGRPIQRFEAYNEEEEAEWIARQIEGADRRQGLAADPSGGRRRGRDPAAGHRRHVPDERPVPGDRGGVPPLRHPLPARRRHAVLPAARGQGRAGVPAGPALGHRRGELRAGHQRAGPGDRRADPGGASALPRRARRTLPGGDRGGPRPARTRALGDALPNRARGVRRAHPAAPGARRGAAAAGAARRGPRAVGLPGDARRRLGGGRGALGEPARAARRSRPATTTSRPRTRSTGCSRRPRSWPTRTRYEGGRGRRDADHPPRRQGPRVPGRLHRRPRGRASSRTPAPSRTRRSSRRSAGSRTSA